MRLTLELPLPENLGNARMHWRVKLARKKAYWQTLNTLLAAKKLPKPPAEPITPALASVHFYVWNVMDRGNAMARLKWIEDWLTAHGYIADDSPEHLDYAGFPEQTIDRRNQRVEVTVERAA